MKNDLLCLRGRQLGNVQTSSPLTERFSDSWDFKWEGKNANDKTDFDRFSEDEGLTKTAGVKIIRGRDMDLTSYPTDSSAMLLNESAAAAMGFKDPIGQIVRDDVQTYHVIGVIKDFVLGSPYEPTRPMVIEGSQSFFNIINMKLTPGVSTEKSLSTIGNLFKKVCPRISIRISFRRSGLCPEIRGHPAYRPAHRFVCRSHDPDLLSGPFRTGNLYGRKQDKRDRG